MRAWQGKQSIWHTCVTRARYAVGRACSMAVRAAAVQLGCRSLQAAAAAAVRGSMPLAAPSHTFHRLSCGIAPSVRNISATWHARRTSLGPALAVRVHTAVAAYAIGSAQHTAYRLLCGIEVSGTSVLPGMRGRQQ